MPKFRRCRSCASAIRRSTWTESASLVDCGRVVTGGGVTLGIDATLHLLARLLGDDVANETARIMEYSRAWRANREALPVIVQ